MKSLRSLILVVIFGAFSAFVSTDINLTEHFAEDCTVQTLKIDYCAKYIPRNLSENVGQLESPPSVAMIVNLSFTNEVLKRLLGYYLPVYPSTAKRFFHLLI